MRGKEQWAMIMPRAGETTGITARKSSDIGSQMWITLVEDFMNDVERAKRGEL